MKSFTGFKYQSSVLKTVDEPPVKKKFNWDRLLFIILLAAVIGYFTYNFYAKVAYLSVKGQVLLDKMSVNFTGDIRMVNRMIDEGDAISEGDSLFTYYLEDMDQFNNQMNNINIRTGGESDNWFLRERMRTKQNIDMKKSERRGVKSLLAGKRKELEEQKKQILLGIDVAHKIPPLQAQIIRYQSDIRVIDQEIKAFKRYLYELRKQEKLKQEQAEQMLAEAKKGGAANQLQSILYHYVSPINGVAGKININPNEVCYESHNVMVIHKLEDIKVRAYFDQINYNDIHIGEEVVIEFLDGVLGKGVISNTYISTYPLPPEFQSKYESTTRTIVADILPLNEEEALRWSSYYKMTVKVHKQSF